MNGSNHPTRPGGDRRRLFHGWMSLGFMAATCTVGAYGILLASNVAAGLYAIVCAAGMATVLCAFCTKCPCRKTGCRHIVLGLVSTIFPQRREGAYSPVEIMLTAIGFGVIVLFPQYWLVRRLPLFLLFWALAGVLLAEIGLFVCKGCGNVHCPANVRIGTGSGDQGA